MVILLTLQIELYNFRCILFMNSKFFHVLKKPNKFLFFIFFPVTLLNSLLLHSLVNSICYFLN